MKVVKIASVSTDNGNKSAYDAASTRYHVPERFRKGIAVGQHMLVVEKEYNETEKLPDGSTKLVDGKPINTGKTFVRTDVTMVGDFKAVTIAAHEDKINAGIAEGIVAAEIVSLRKEYNVPTEKELVGSIA